MSPEIDSFIKKTETSFYLFDCQKLNRRVKYLKEHLPEKVKLCYAVKANTFLIDCLRDILPRFEICSPGEQRICQKLRIDSRRQVISGVYKTPALMEELISDQSFQGIFTVESETQYSLLLSLARKYKKNIPVLLRVTNDSQFGMDEETVARLVENRSQAKELSLNGIQFFSGTQKTSLKKLKRELLSMDAFLMSLKERFDYEAPEFEYGPGFPVSYFPSEPFDEEALLSGFSEALLLLKFQGEIYLELGRSIAASCGSFFTKVVDEKVNKGVPYLLVDGGMHQLSYFGQYMAMKQPYFYVYGKEREEAEETYVICGSLCSMNDILVKQAFLPKTKIGDTLVFLNTGAYSVTEGIALFLSRELPAVYLLKEDGRIEAVRERVETWKLNTIGREEK